MDHFGFSLNIKVWRWTARTELKVTCTAYPRPQMEAKSWNFSHWCSSSNVTSLFDFINTKHNPSFFFPCSFLSSPSLPHVPASSFYPPLLFSSPPSFFLLPFIFRLSSLFHGVLLSSVNMTERPSQRGSTPISSSSALILQSRPSCWYRRGSLTSLHRMRSQPVEKVTTAFIKQTAERNLKQAQRFLKGKRGA